MKRFLVGVAIGICFGALVVQAQMITHGRPQIAAHPVKTGQTTQYNSLADDGSLQRGVARSFVALSTGQYSGTTNINLVQITAATISFTTSTPGTVNDSGNGLAMFQTGDTIVITGTASNNGTYTVSTGNLATGMRTTQATATEGAGASMSIAKREAHNNGCVFDNRTGLMWSATVCAGLGTTFDGRLPFYDATKVFNIFTYAAAANTAALAGYADWRVPNINELMTIINQEDANGCPYSTYWASYPTVYQTWSSTTPKITTTNGMAAYRGYIASTTKSTGEYCLLVRGGDY